MIPRLIAYLKESLTDFTPFMIYESAHLPFTGALK
jgi:hypothetical protein